MKSQLFKLSQAVDFGGEVGAWGGDEAVWGRKVFAIQFSSINYGILLRAAVCEFTYAQRAPKVLECFLKD